MSMHKKSPKLSQKSKTQKSIKFLSCIKERHDSQRVFERHNPFECSLTKEDLIELKKLDKKEINYIVEKISDKRKSQIIKFLEAVPDIDDDFKFILSRELSSISDISENNQNIVMGTNNSSSFDSLSSKVKRIAKVFAKPPWIDENLEYHNKFCTDIPRDDLFGVMKIPKSRKKRVTTKMAEENPFVSIIQKMMFSFGDFDCVNNFLTSKEIEDYIKSVWPKYLKKTNSSKINERLVFKLYDAEIRDYNKIKNIMKDVNDFKDNEYDISFIPKEALDENEFDENSNKNNIEIEESDEEDKDSESIEIEEELESSVINLQEERKIFYSSLADSMDQVQYDTFYKCRNQTFLIKGKDVFLDWIQVECSKQFVEVLAHLAYNEVRLLVENSNRNLNPDRNLARLSAPITINQILNTISERK